MPHQNRRMAMFPRAVAQKVNQPGLFAARGGIELWRVGIEGRKILLTPSRSKRSFASICGRLEGNPFRRR